MLGRITRVHLVGIGGAGMSGIAEILLSLGFEVSGSDLAGSSTTERLSRLGARVTIGHSGKNVVGAGVIACSTAVGPDNPEVLAGRRYNIPVISRAEILAEVMRLKYPLAVAGTHGKTTTASFIYTILADAGLEPTAVIGGKLKALASKTDPAGNGAATGAGATLGSGDYFIVEADESDGTFLAISPTFALVTNIDEDHLNYYSGLDEIRGSFIRFANSVPFYGAAVLCLDDPGVQGILPELNRRYITYGFTAQCDVVGREVRLAPFSASYKLFRGNEELGEVDLALPGRHNVLNSLGAAALALELGVPPEVITRSLRSFKGIEMRLEVLGHAGDITIIHDYAHHPAEIAATLEAMRTGLNKRIVAVFQPHRYTRTKALFERFLRCFYQADRLIITDIYPAGEPEIPGVSAEALARGVAEHGHREVTFIRDRRKIPAAVAGMVADDDLVLVLGAGNIWETARDIANKLAEERG
ncbi:MAG TPA: UDP-N-acetylmuramate--L-alanine ligase [Candidatus Coatesbacteria bacterium]|nr:UDP-N-acetylmuramate--L-alanine ligase [Candidatus Coatesbacteria bacterium]